MGLPKLRRCCGYLSLEVGSFILCLLSIIFCIAYIVAGAWNLPSHKEREQEDNLISMTMVMFSTLSLISNFVILIGIRLRRPGCLQLSLLFNSVFILCIFLVATVTCLFSPELEKFINKPANIVLIVFLFIAGVAFSLYYMTVVNSLYRKMKAPFSESAYPM